MILGWLFPASSPTLVGLQVSDRWQGGDSLLVGTCGRWASDLASAAGAATSQRILGTWLDARMRDIDFHRSSILDVEGCWILAARLRSTQLTSGCGVCIVFLWRVYGGDCPYDRPRRFRLGIWSREGIDGLRGVCGVRVGGSSSSKFSRAGQRRIGHPGTVDDFEVSARIICHNVLCGVAWFVLEFSYYPG